MNPIDPRAFGSLEATVEAQGRELAEIKTTLRELKTTVEAMRDQMTEARGGWKTLMLLGGAGATFGSALTWAASQLHLIKPGP